MNRKDRNPWTPEDEREHFPSVVEWWTVEAFFKSIEDNKNWFLRTEFYEQFIKSKTTSSTFSITLFDIDNHKHFRYFSKNDYAKLKSARDRFDVKYDDSHAKGSYPDYEFHIKDQKNNIELDLKYNAESLPHWVAQDATNGWLPMGTGFYRYGFISKNSISGTMKIGNEIFTINGKGYFDHVWGDFSYYSSLSNFLKPKKLFSTYLKLVSWWVHNHRICIPKSITFTTENNPTGYDWGWALLDNGWTIFYGNIMFWIAEGPITGILILSKDGKMYTEFCNASFRYNKTILVDGYDFYYPSEYEVTVISGIKKIYLRFKMADESIIEYITRFSKGKFYPGYSFFEAPGNVSGYYFDGTKKIELHGLCKMESKRVISKIGHNSLKLDFVLPPKGIGISFDFDSHLLNKKIFSKIQLAPRPKINFKINKINIISQEKNKRCRYIFYVMKF